MICKSINFYLIGKIFSVYTFIKARYNLIYSNTKDLDALLWEAELFKRIIKKSTAKDSIATRTELIK